MRISDWSSDVCSSDLWCSSRSTCPTRTTRDLDPINIRALCLQADAELSGDPQLRAAAQRTVQRDEQDRAMIRLSCIAQLTRDCGIAKGDARMVRPNTRTLMEDRKTLVQGKRGALRLDLVGRRKIK